MLACSALFPRGFAALSFCFFLAQCAVTTKPEPAPVVGPTGSTKLDLRAKEPVDVQIFSDAAPDTQAGIQFTLLSRVDKKIEIGFPDGTETLELTKGVVATAVFVYDQASGRVTLETCNGKSTRGPKEVLKRGSFNPIRKLGPITERPAQSTADGRPRTYVTGRNDGLEFSFTLVGSR